MNKVSLQNLIEKKTVLVSTFLLLISLLTTTSIISFLIYQSTSQISKKNALETSAILEKVINDQSHHLDYICGELQLTSNQNIKQQIIDNYLQKHTKHTALWITDAKGKVILYSSLTGNMKNFNMVKHISFISNDKKGNIFSPVYLSTLTREPVIAISRWINNNRLIVIEFPLKNLNNDIKNIIAHFASRVTVTDKNAHWIIHPDSTLINKRETNLNFSQLSKKSKNGLFSYISFFNGVPVVTSVTTVKKDDWIVEVHYSLKNSIKTILIILIINLIIGIISTIILHKNIRNFIIKVFIPIKDLITASSELGKGNFKYSLKEYEYIELDELSKSFKVMKENINEREKEEKRLWEQLNQSQKMEAIGNLAGGIAHDFNNILCAIGGFAEILEVELDTNSSQHRSALQISKAAQRASSLTKQLLVFSRKEKIIPKIICINELLENLISMLERLVGEDIKLILETPSEQLFIKADPHQIEQVIMNLTVNAADALNSSNTKNACIKINIFKNSDNNKIAINISDNGPGIADDIKDKIFEPFFTTKPKDKGTGMGLSMVYGIVKQNNASIQLETSSSTGTLFTIYWNLSKKEETIQENKSEEFSNNKSLNIIVVDDEEMVLEVIELHLIKFGYKVKTFTSSINALETIKNNNFSADLLITDVIMPEMSGDELYKKVKEIKPHIKVIFMSGYTGDKFSGKNISFSEKTFLNKPISKEDIKTKIESLFS